MLKLMRTHWLLTPLLIAGLIVLGLGTYHVTPPAPMCVIDAGNLVPRCFTDDGKRVLTLSNCEPNGHVHGPLQIIDCRTGAEFGRHFDGEQVLPDPAFSRNGRRFAAEIMSRIHTLHLVDLGTGTALEVPLDDDRVGRLHFTPAGEILVRQIDGREGLELQIRDGATGRLLAKHVSKQQHLPLADLTDEAVVFRTQDRQQGVWDVEIWSVRERKSVATLTNAWYPVNSPDGRYYAIKQMIAGTGSPGKWMTWSMQTRRIEAEFQTQREEPAYALISADNRWLALPGPNHKFVELREFPSGRPVAKLPEQVLGDMRFSPDGRWLALEVAHPSTPLTLVEVPTLAVLWRQEQPGQAWMEFSADSDTIYTVSKDHAALVARACATGHVRARIALGPGAKPPSMHMTPDRCTLLVQQRHGSPVENWFQRVPWLGHLLQRESDCLVVVDTNTCRERFRLAGWGTRSALLSDDGATLVTTDIEQTRMMLRCWDVDAHKPLHCAIGVPAGLGALVVLVAWWRGRKTGGAPCSS